MPNCQYIAVAGEGQQDHKEQILRGGPSRRAAGLWRKLTQIHMALSFDLTS